MLKFMQFCDACYEEKPKFWAVLKVSSFQSPAVKAPGRVDDRSLKTDD
jgi:hypothetical protein